MAIRRTGMRRFPKKANRTNSRRSVGPTFERLEARTLLAAYVPGEVLVQFDAGEDLLSRAVVRTAVGAELVEEIHTRPMIAAGEGILERIQVSGNWSVEDAIAKIQNLPGVKFAEPNWIYTSTAVSNDPYYLKTTGNLWGMYGDDSPTPVGPTGTTNAFGIHAENAWNNGFLGSDDVYVGIIDTGIQYTHPDLTGNFWTNPFDPTDGVDNDGNGRIDDIRGWDFYSNNNSIYDGTFDDHGTHVAGTIGATGGNGVGVAGVNWNVTMISGKFIGSSGTGTTSGAIQALDYFTDLKTRHDLNIVATNNSWGGGGYSASLLAAIVRGAQQDILFIAAAGNDGANNDSTPSYPSNYNTTSGAGYDAVVAVAAITSSGTKWTWSNYGATQVDLGAPGVGIYSSVPTNAYASYMGTSMATPHVTGAVALYASADTNATAAQIRAALLNNTTATSSLATNTVTGGRLDVDKMLSSISPIPNVGISDVTLQEGNSGTTSFVFNVSLSSSSTSTVTVNFATAHGTTDGSDFASNSGTVTFTPGQVSQPVTIFVNGDLSQETDEGFFVQLSNPSNASINDASGTGTIQNDDSIPVPNVTITNVTKIEGNGGTRKMDFKVKLSTTSTNPVSVDYTTQDDTATAPSDYTAVSGTAVVAPGLLQTIVTVWIKGDTAIEENEKFFVVLSNAVNGNITDSLGQGTITNDDVPQPPQISIANTSKLEGNSGQRKFDFKVTLNQVLASDVTFNYSTADGTAIAPGDYQSASGSGVITAGLTQTIVSVWFYGDTEFESDETVLVNLADAVNATINDGQGQGTIKNDDEQSMSQPPNGLIFMPIDDPLRELASNGPFTPIAKGQNRELHEQGTVGPFTPIAPGTNHDAPWLQGSTRADRELVNWWDGSNSAFGMDSWISSDDIRFSPIDDPISDAQDLVQLIMDEWHV